jgi:hypothetical protein
MRLVDVAQAQYFNSRGHFFAAAGEAMRRILVEQARRLFALRSATLEERSQILHVLENAGSKASRRGGSSHSGVRLWKNVVKSFMFSKTPGPKQNVPSLLIPEPLNPGIPFRFSAARFPFAVIRDRLLWYGMSPTACL